MFTPQEAINRLCDKREIFFDEMVDLMRQVMEGKVSQVQLAAIIVVDTSPLMIERMIESISSRKISRCSMTLVNASCGVIGSFPESS